MWSNVACGVNAHTHGAPRGSTAVVNFLYAMAICQTRVPQYCSCC